MTVTWIDAGHLNLIRMPAIGHIANVISSAIVQAQVDSNLISIKATEQIGKTVGNIAVKAA